MCVCVPLYVGSTVGWGRCGSWKGTVREELLVTLRRTIDGEADKPTQGCTHTHTRDTLLTHTHTQEVIVGMRTSNGFSSLSNTCHPRRVYKQAFMMGFKCVLSMEFVSEMPDCCSVQVIPSPPVLTGVLDAGPHALVQPAPPLPRSQGLVLAAGVQAQGLSLGLGCQLRCPPLCLHHQPAQVGFSALHTHDYTHTHAHTHTHIYIGLGTVYHKKHISFS